MDLEPQCPGGDLRLSQHLRLPDCIGRMPEDGHPAEVRRRLTV